MELDEVLEIRICEFRIKSVSFFCGSRLCRADIGRSAAAVRLAFKARRNVDDQLIEWHVTGAVLAGQDRFMHSSLNHNLVIFFVADCT